MVPSTPKLAEPRRPDGFAEAVSSPQVSVNYNLAMNSYLKPGLEMFCFHYNIFSFAESSFVILLVLGLKQNDAQIITLL